MTIEKLLTPYNFTDKNDTGRIKYIVIHYVGATGGAKANCQYYASKYIGASAHYFIGFNGEVWQSVEDGDVAWHCGATSYKHTVCRNSNSIGIEMCVRKKSTTTVTGTDKDWYFEDATVKKAIELTRELMIKYNISAENVIRHYDVTGKICPNPYVYDHTKHTWDDFKKGLVTVKGEWIRAADGIRWWYRLDGDNGNYAKGGFYNIGGYKYLFDDAGYMCTGLIQWNDERYLFAPEDNGNMGKMMHTNPFKDHAVEFVIE